MGRGWFGGESKAAPGALTSQEEVLVEVHAPSEGELLRQRDPRGGDLNEAPAEEERAEEESDGVRISLTASKALTKLRARLIRVRQRLLPSAFQTCSLTQIHTSLFCTFDAARQLA